MYGDPNLSSTRGPRAYVLDDDAAVGKVACRMLAEIGFEACHFQCSVAFLAEMKAKPPALVLLDLVLGSTDAVEVIRQLSMISFSGPVLLISGKDQRLLSDVQEIGTAHGVAMLPSLQKPFRVADLRQLLAAQPERYVPSMPSRRDIAVDVEEALQRRWLELWYQPKIDLKKGALCGAEALLRVRHPELGVLGAASVLPRSDDPSHRSIFEFVVQQALKDWRTLLNRKINLRLSINAPVSILHSGDLPTLIRKRLPIDPHFPGLLVEITEDDVIRDPSHAREIATQLKLYNVLLSIDDFGAGSASLSRLRDLPFHELKLDRAFVADCATNENNRAVCEAAVKIGHQFQTVVCAEGVESAADASMLCNLGFDLAQGFFFAKPMPLSMFVEALTLGSAKPLVRRSSVRAA